MEKIIRVDMTRQTVLEETSSSELSLLGGRSLIDRILTNEVNPRVHPLGKGNKLIIAPGLFAATSLPNANRLSIGAKSPLTSGAKEANAGGEAALKLARLGIKALIIEGLSESGLFILVIKKDSIMIEPASKYSMLGNYKLCDNLREKYGDIAIISIGPCGEMRMSAASIAVSDMNGFPSRHCARGGLGAVMGAKGLKAIIIDDTGGSNQKAENSVLFKKAVKEAVELIKSNPALPLLQSKGTAAFLPVCSGRGSMPTRNYSFGTFEGADRLSGEAMVEIQKDRGGSNGHGCTPGCIVKCSNVYYNSKKEYLTSGFEYETLAMLGANLDISDLDTVAAMDRKCDDYGLDTIDIGAALGVLTETGHFEFGDKEKALGLIDEIGRGSTLGMILGHGVVTTCRVFGIARVPAVKGQAIPAHDARALKGIGVTYATSPQGADHTAGYVSENPLLPEGHIEISTTRQLNILFLDSCGLCYYTALGGQWPLFAQLVNGLHGVEYKDIDLIAIAHNAIGEEMDFNRKAGINEKSDQLPEFLEEEPLGPNNTVFDVSKEDLKKAIKILVN